MLRILFILSTTVGAAGVAVARRRGKRPQALGCAIATEPQRLPAMHRHASMKPARQTRDGITSWWKTPIAWPFAVLIGEIVVSWLW